MATDTLPEQRDADRPASPSRRPDRHRAGPRRLVGPLLLPLLLVAFAGLLRFINLDEPGRIYFDEVYYANDAREYLDAGVEMAFAVHPPVGKWLIAAGIAAFGFEPVGWRVAAAAAGTLLVLAVYLAGLRLFRRRGIAALAALLLAVDGIAFTMSRIAMLDIFLALFVVVGFWLLLLDRDEQWAAATGPASPAADGAVATGGRAPARLPRYDRRYRWLAGVAFGLALATKWSGLLAIGAAGLFVLGSELLWRRRLTGRTFTRLVPIVASGIATLVAVPALVYVASYLPWFANYEHTRPGEAACESDACSMSATDMLAGWWDEQGDILHFHQTLETDHPYRATALTWPTLYRPVAYYYESCKTDRDFEEDGPCEVDRGLVAEILGIGNPAIWWGALVFAYPLLLFAAVRWRDWRAWAILLFIFGQYLPWLVLSRPLFFFYTTPIVPFICLGLAWVAWRALDNASLRWLPGVIAAAAVAGFLFWYPVFTGLEITSGAWNFRILLDSWR